MTHRVRTLHPHSMRLSRGKLLLAASLALTACGDSDAVGPDGSRSATVVFTVSTTAPLASLGDSISLAPRVLDQRGRPVGDARLRWSVRPAGVVQQDGEGVFRAIGNGRATIVAEVDPGTSGVRPAGYWVGSLADSAVVEVRQHAVRLALAPTDTTFTALGGARQLRVQVTDARGHPLVQAPPALRWQSSDARVVAVDSGGVARSVAEGSARVTVHGADLAGAATFTVRPRRPHTSCMVFARRRQTRRSCVTLDLVVREREVAR
jgi:hypothetical protein